MVKALIDCTLAAVALIVLSPVLLIIALMVRLTSRGPAFYLQTRVGRNGRQFRMVKFRTMQVGADSATHLLLDRNDVDGGILFKLRQDPRVTSVGRVLRRYSLDELPQLWNVLSGAMSLVGPRPALPTEVARYSPDHRRRLAVRPGLTGLWQVSGRSDLSWNESIRLDLHYIDTWSLRTDLALLARTGKAVLSASGAY